MKLVNKSKRLLMPAVAWLSLVLVGSLFVGCETTGSSSGGSSRAPALAGAAKENPFVNTLGMKFVPVPGTNVLMQTTEVTVDQYNAAGLGYQAPPFPQGGNHPAVHVSWNDAKAYAEWLSQKEGKKYRLPTDHEWSCAVGIGHLENPQATPESKDRKLADVYPWGGGKPKGRAGNYMGQEWNNAEGAAAFKRVYPWLTKGWTFIPDYTDGHLFTGPVGSYAANSLGIYDLGGSVWEWCEDAFRPAAVSRVARGGAWNDDSRVGLLSSCRSGSSPERRMDDHGFRLVVVGSEG